jgi:hypothetical protein
MILILLEVFKIFLLEMLKKSAFQTLKRKADFFTAINHFSSRITCKVFPRI